MSNGVSNNGNNEISIQELQKKLANIEQSRFQEEGLKSIFNAYNTTSAEGDNAVEFLDKNELSALVNDIQKYDGKISGNADGVIDMDEAELFARDFNTKHQDANVKSSDVFQFAQKVIQRYSVNIKGPVASDGPLPETVGKPLGEKTVSLKCNVNNKVETISVNIKLFSTKDKEYGQLFKYTVVDGKEFVDSMMEQLGFSGDNALLDFLNKSTRSSQNSYDILFNPQYASTKGTENESAVTPFAVSAESVEGLEDVYIVPVGFEKDPRIIAQQYENPEVQQVMNDFMEYLTVSIEDAQNIYDGNKKNYGATAWIADGISHIWNNKYTVVNTGNTADQVEEALSKAKVLLEKMQASDNSLQAVLEKEDFGSYFKELTGIEFDSSAVKDFLKERKTYLKEQATIALYNHVHTTLDDTINNFEQKYNVLINNPLYAMEERYNDAVASDDKDAAVRIAMAQASSTNAEFASYGKSKNSFNNANDELYKAFYPVLGVSRENWDKMLADFKERGVNPIEFLRGLANFVTQEVDGQAEEVLGTSNPERIKAYQESSQRKYELVERLAIGKSDLMKKVDNYHNSQVIGSTVVSAALQIALYSVGMSYLGVLGSGLASGVSYSGSYLALEVLDRATNDIDDLCNLDSVTELIRNTGIEFVAGYLFDGILKSKVFGRAEDAAFKAEQAARQAEALAMENASAIGEAAVEMPNKLFTKEKILKILGVRGMAAIAGGTKDSTKEVFKQILKGKFKLSDICTAFLIGAVSNAFLIRFKKTSFAKKDHKIMGKMIEKGPKKEAKVYSKEEEYLTSDEKDYLNIMREVKKSILCEMNDKLSGQDRAEVEDFITNNEAILNELIMDCYIMEYLAQ